MIASLARLSMLPSSKIEGRKSVKYSGGWPSSWASVEKMGKMFCWKMDFTAAWSTSIRCVLVSPLNRSTALW